MASRRETMTLNSPPKPSIARSTSSIALGIDVLSAHDEHVVDAPVEPLGQPRIRAGARRRARRSTGPGRPTPAGSWAATSAPGACTRACPRRRRARAGSGSDRTPRCRRGPARGASRSGAGTRRWSSRASSRPCEPMSTQTPPKSSSIWRLVAGMPAPGSPEKKSVRKPKLARIDALAPGRLGEVERIGRRAVEGGGLEISRPAPRPSASGR